MRSMITAMALLMLGSVAMAQTSGTGTGSSSQANPPRSGPEAPVGHRQPRADQVPSEKNLSDPNDATNREDAALDRKIKSICRGC
jgi:hypothetical protein